MPEIHIAEEPIDETVQEAAKLEAQARKLDEISAWGEWLSGQSDTIQALAVEWQSLRGSRFQLSQIKNDKGLFFVCESEHGIHMSKQSFEHALFLLVDSHRTRIEDTPAFRDRVQAANAGMTPKEALRRCEQIAHQIRAANPTATGEERDVLALAHLDALEKAAAEPLVPVMELDP